jgi:hypothetical protein
MSETCNFPAVFRDKAMASYLGHLQEFIYSQVCNSIEIDI